jgi:hypothetical protein
MFCLSTVYLKKIIAFTFVLNGCEMLVSLYEKDIDWGRPTTAKFYVEYLSLRQTKQRDDSENYITRNFQDFSVY